jgi:phage-related protein
MAKALLALQKGERPQLETRPMPSIETGVFELKDGDRDTWYRLMYTGKYKNRIYVLHCFTKKSTKTPKSDLETTGKRLKDVKKRLMEEPKHGERTSTHHSRQRI